MASLSTSVVNSVHELARKQYLLLREKQRKECVNESKLKVTGVSKSPFTPLIALQSLLHSLLAGRCERELSLRRCYLPCLMRILLTTNAWQSCW